MLDLVGVPEIAELLGVSRRTAWRYIEHPAFPEPVAQVTAKRLWAKTDVVRWAEKNLPFAKDPRKP